MAFFRRWNKNKRALRGVRPRVGIDLHVLEGIHQGSRTHCLELFSRAIPKMPEIDFRCFVDMGRWDAGMTATFRAPNSSVIHMAHTHPIARLGVHLPRLCEEHQIDLLHTQYNCPLFGRMANAVTIHDILFEEYPQYFGPMMRYRAKLLFRRSAHRAEMVFTVSDYSKREIAKTYGVPETSLTTILNGVDRSRFFPGSEGADEVAALGLASGEYLLTVGRLEPRKNHAMLLRAMAMLPAPRPRLLVVGQRDFDFEAVFRLRDELRLQKDVQFLETANDNLLASLYRNCKAFVYPTFAEGFGMPVLEAMASGAPVITSNTTSLPEIAGDSGVFVDPRSVSSIANAIQRVLMDEDLRATLREKGLERCKTFDWDNSAEALASAYRSYFRSLAASQSSSSPAKDDAKAHGLLGFKR